MLSDRITGKISSSSSISSSSRSIISGNGGNRNYNCNRNVDNDEQQRQVPQHQEQRRSTHSILAQYITLLAILVVIVAGWIDNSFYAIISLSDSWNINNENTEGDVSSSSPSTTTNMLSYYCNWNPTNQEECSKMVFQHISTSLERTRHQFLQQQQIIHNNPFNTTNITMYYGHHADGNDVKYLYDNHKSVLNRRYLLLGDSTVFRLYIFSSLKNYLQSLSITRQQRYRQQIPFQQIQQQCSTMNNDNSNINNQTSSSSSSTITCSQIDCGRCDTAEKLQLQRKQKWEVPNFVQFGEGPIKFGYKNPYCTDCDGCNTQFLSCRLLFDDSAMTQIRSNNNNGDDVAKCIMNEIENNMTQTTRPYVGASYGGYISIEFARDVEIQTAEYKTTQENVLLNYIHTNFNTIPMLYEFGYPICIVSAGRHDVAIEGITKAIYIQNVAWYLQLLQQQCEYIIWISNNCPATDDYVQTANITYEWNMEVYDIIRNMTTTTTTTTTSCQSCKSNNNNIFFLDVFNASVTYKHQDNIHMSNEWYASLGTFLQRIMDQVTQ